MHYLIRQLILSVFTLLGITALAFSMIRLAPGSPVDYLLPDNAPAGAAAALVEQLGLNKPLHIQFWIYITGLVQGDWGRSVVTRQPVLDLLHQNIAHTLDLTLAAFLVGLIIGIPGGMWAAVRKDTWIDHSSRVLSLTGVSVPHFVIGLVLMLLFSGILKWFPITGELTGLGFGARLKFLVLPALALGTTIVGVIMRTTRAAVLEVMGEQYITTARSKGLSQFTIMSKHVARNVAIPVLTIAASMFGRLIGFVGVVEVQFARPGLGRLLVSSINERDYGVAQAVIIVACCMVLGANIVVDLLYRAIDPRVRFE